MSNSKMNQILHFALIGCGRISTEHLSQIARVGKLVAVVDVDLLKAKQTGFQFGVPFFTSTVQLYSSKIEMDIVVIATPNGLHAAQAIEALENGYHVLVEKPVALTTSDISLIQAAAEKAGKNIYTIMQNRFNPPVQMIKALLREHALGAIQNVRVKCFWHRPASYYTDSWHGTLLLDGGVLYTQYSHFIDLLCWFLGKGKLLEASFNNRLHEGLIEFEDEGNLKMIFENNISVQMEYGINEPQINREGSIEIIGEKGRVKAGGAYLNEWDYSTDDSVLQKKIDLLLKAFFSVTNTDVTTMSNLYQPSFEPNNYGNYKGSMRNHHKVYDNLVQSLKHQVPYYTTIEEAKNTIELINLIYQAR
ncbi:Gfo/Idh/MocA family protein [Sediminibacterium sp. TEGAF015]|uniref:Gfo/Idh/MocA family protein n=1 Tax=Sediminibacterium sp. TEGAF015 TaxID=575378 RepID=UPI0022035FC2|nr:Gfo/Idh/MocA family oxidoreductase [Sediminibacterium sp. TEGAF015]BDQ13051.1 oxidoreductase [Sediminibacterium sp. TEGAF015]